MNAMPEYPDLENYREAFLDHFTGTELTALEILHPFVLRSVEPEPAALVGRSLRDVRRLAKRLVLDFGDEHFAVMHLMIAGRLRLEKKPTRSAPKRSVGNRLCRFVFAERAVLLREEGSKRRASLAIVRGMESLAGYDPGGIDLFEIDVDGFLTQLRRENRTLKRALTDQRLFAGIGNAYSDEILHAARLSPFKTTANVAEDEAARLFTTARQVLTGWTDRLREERCGGWPGKVTAFHPAMAVHGRYGEPCPVCGTEVQRIRYADNESNYCPRCQTDGALLKDRALSRLLRDDWPSRIEELEGRQG